MSTQSIVFVLRRKPDHRISWPDPSQSGGASVSEGVAVDHQGNIYGAEVGPKDLKKYMK